MIQLDPSWCESEGKSGSTTTTTDLNGSFWMNLTLPNYNRCFYCTLKKNLNLEPSNDTYKELSTHGLSMSCSVPQPGVLHTRLYEKQVEGIAGGGAREAYSWYCYNPTTAFNTRKATNTNMTFCFDVFNDFYLTGNNDGGLFVFEAENGRIKQQPIRSLLGHVSDIYTTKFFPSGTVVLSGGGDFVLKIWTLMQEGICVAELKGHKRGILSSALIDRGRNLVSSSLDGTSILWDVPTQTKIYTWEPDAGTINECKISDEGGVIAGEMLDKRDVSTAGKTLLLACESGKLYSYDLSARSKIFSCSTSSPVNTVVGIPATNMVVTGGQDGTVALWDTRNISGDGGVPVKSINADNTPITKTLPSTHKNACWFSCGNGTTFEWDFEKDTTSLSLVSDTEPINGLTYQKSNVLATISRRGIIRIYPSIYYSE